MRYMNIPQLFPLWKYIQDCDCSTIYVYHTCLNTLIISYAQLSKISSTLPDILLGLAMKEYLHHFSEEKQVENIVEIDY